MNATKFWETVNYQFFKVSRAQIIRQDEGDGWIEGRYLHPLAEVHLYSETRKNGEGISTFEFMLDGFYHKFSVEQPLSLRGIARYAKQALEELSGERSQS